MTKKIKIFRIEHFEKGFYEFQNITEAKKWAREMWGEEVRILVQQKYHTIKEIKKDKNGMMNLSFTEEIERI